MPVSGRSATDMIKNNLLITLPMLLVKYVWCEHQCLEDGDCIVTQHDMCCLDLSDLSLASQPDRSDWNKKCCSENTGNPIIWPENMKNLTEFELQQVRTKTTQIMHILVFQLLRCIIYTAKPILPFQRILSTFQCPLSVRVLHQSCQ